MISIEEIQALLRSTENFRVERTVSTTNMDKFCEAICAFSNDLPDSRQKGYLLIGAHDDGRLSGLKLGEFVSLGNEWVNIFQNMRHGEPITMNNVLKLYGQRY